MNPERLLQHFDRISEAPDAIRRLRRFILDLAVRGKLVEQDPSDEPVAELLKRIQVEKARLQREGLIAGEKPLLTGLSAELSFSIPNSWRCTRFIDYAIDISTGPFGSILHQSDYMEGGVPLVNPSHMVKGRIVPEQSVAVSHETGKRLSAYKLRVGDIVMARRGEVGRAAVVYDKEDGWLCGTGSFFLRFTEEVCREYLMVLLRCEFIRNYLAGEAVGITMVNLNHGILKRMPLPVPPLAEQHRIVAKVDELMTLCDQLAAAKTEREQSRDRLVASSLHRLNSPADTTETDAPDLLARQADAFRTHARFVFNHLPRLTTRPEHIKQLRQTILNLAVCGKLVPQDSNDEPASELLKRLQEEKARLVKEGKISRENLRIPAGDNELAFELKPGWQATKISQILVELQTGPFGSSLHQSDYQKGGIPVINPASIKNEQLIPIDGMAVGPGTLERLATFKLRTGDIVMGRRGEMGRCAVVTEHESGWLCGTGSLILRLPECIFPRFLVTLIGSPFVREYLGGSAVGATMQNLNQSILLNLVIGLPPLAEQHRIVARVDELMALCDQLEAQLTATEADSHRLLEAVLHKALNPLAERTERPRSRHRPPYALLA